MEGDLTGNAHSAYARLLDDNPDLEAVFCVNDETAAGFYEELKARGLMPGRDMTFLYGELLQGLLLKLL